MPKKGKRTMTTLVPLDGSQSSLDALKYALRRRPAGNVLLLYVAPSARQQDLERGKFLLEEGVRTGQVIARDVTIETRLEVGDRRSKLPEVVEDSECDLVVMSAHGLNAMPHVDPVDQEASHLTEQLHRPVVLVLPTGQGIRTSADNEPGADVDEAPDEEEENAGQAV